MSIKTHEYENDTGFISLEGDDIKSGKIDILSARLIIEGTQFALDYMLKREDNSLSMSETANYPISVRDGCWELIIPFLSYIGGVASSAFTKGANAYSETAGKKLAEKHFDKKESKEIFENAFKNLQIVIKIAQHLGVVDKTKALDIKLVDYKKKSVILKNRKGNVLSTTMDEIDVFLACPEKLLRLLASAVTDYRTLNIGYKKDNKIYVSTIDRDTRDIFVIEDEPQEPVLAELKHGEHVTIEGHVSRGNESTNTIGFKYNDHTITCEPSTGKVSDYLNAHYKKCELTGLIIRTPQEEIELGKRDRPKIIFDNLIVIEKKRSPQTSLLE